MKSNLKPGVLIHEHKNGGSYTISSKLAKFSKGEIILLSSVANKKDFLKIHVGKILGVRSFCNLSDIREVDKKISLWNIGYPSPIILPIMILSKKPKIITFHFMFSQHPFKFAKESLPYRIINKFLDIFYKGVVNLLVLSADKFVFITKAQFKEYKDSIFFNKTLNNKSIVINNFIEKDKIKNKKLFSNSEIKVLFVGRLEKLKGFHELLRLIEAMPQGDRIKFNIIGNGKLKTLIPKKEGVSHVESIPYNKILGYYDKSNILILPSHSEVFPMAILEAMARGLVILVSDIPGMREIVKEGRNGYLFPPGDVGKMKEIILYLKNNPKEIERVSKNNLKDIWKFTADKQIPKYLKVYEEVLKNKKR